MALAVGLGTTLKLVAQGPDLSSQVVVQLEHMLRPFSGAACAQLLVGKAAGHTSCAAPGLDGVRNTDALLYELDAPADEHSCYSLCACLVARRPAL